MGLRHEPSGAALRVEHLKRTAPKLCACKAMGHLTKLLAKSHGPVRVNCVAPGLVETRITEKGFEGSHAAVRAPWQNRGAIRDRKVIEKSIYC